MSRMTEYAPRRQHRLLMIDPAGPETLSPFEQGVPQPGSSPGVEPLLPWLESLGGELASLSRRMGQPPVSAQVMGCLPDPAHQSLESLEESVVNACSAVRQVISLLAPPAVGRETLNPDQLWVILRSTLQLSAHRNLRLQWDQEPATGWLQVSPADLLKAVQELLRNAIEAMPDGGILGIRQQELVLTAAELSAVRQGHPGALDAGANARPGRPGRAFLCLGVSDTGYGIPPGLLPKVLAGGYSTHSGREGRGLERARAVIEAHQGHLLLDSRVGSGTTVRVLLPLFERSPVESATPVRGRVQSGRGRILLAEDDTGIRDTTAEILERLGYTVLCARDGEEALRQVDAAAEPFDLVILDLLMPVLGGMETLTRLRERDRKLPVMLITGFMMDADQDRSARIRGVPVVQKPFKLSDLSRQVALCMAGAPRADG